MIVRDPIKRYVSDIVHYNARNTKKYENIDGIVKGKVKTPPYYSNKSNRSK